MYMVVKKMHNKIYKNILLVSITIFLFVAFSSSVFAVDYGEGLYDSGFYSSTAPLVPTGTPVAGTYNTTQSVSLTATGSTSIRYSTSAIPTNCSSGTLYSTPISISTSQTIYARACNSLGNSSTATLVYVIGENDDTPTENVTGTSAIAIAQFLAQQQMIATTSNITRTLKQGMTGDDVKELQVYLNNHKYNTGTADGNFGPKTKASVILFQKANGLTPDGVVGAKTTAKINN